MPVYRKMAEDGLNRESLSCCIIGGPPNERTTDESQPRRLVTQVDISRLRLVCVDLTLVQLKERIPPLSSKTVLVLLLYQRTKNALRQ